MRSSGSRITLQQRLCQGQGNTHSLGQKQEHSLRQRLHNTNVHIGIKDARNAEAATNESNAVNIITDEYCSATVSLMSTASENEFASN